MRNFLYKFEFTSGFYENYFYQQIKANDEKKALVEIVSNFKNMETDATMKLLNEFLGEEWTVKDFWGKMDKTFFSQAYQESFYLIDLREINFDLDKA